MKQQYDDSGMVIICEHIYRGSPILYGIRDKPIDDVDSGRQFLCNQKTTEENAKICSVNDIIALEPSLKNLLDQPCGTELIRDNINDQLHIKSADS